MAPFPLESLTRQTVLSGRVNRDGQTDTDIPPPSAEYRRVNSNNLALHVDQGSTGIARIDRGVGLYKIVVRPSANLPALGTNDSRRDGVLKTERASHRYNPLPHLESIRVAQWAG